MRPNLSLSHLALTVGTGALLSACGGEAVAAPPATSATVTTDAPVAPAAPVVAMPAAPAVPAAPVVAVPAAPAAPTGAVAASVAVPAAPAVAVPGKAKPKKPAGANAQASCGAGTCSAMKK
jgi:hypothetical protein